MMPLASHEVTLFVSRVSGSGYFELFTPAADADCGFGNGVTLGYWNL